MRQSIICMGMLAAAAWAFAGCQEETILPEEQPEVKAHVATVTLQKSDDTKTQLVEGEEYASYLWNEDDDQYLHIYENGTEGTITSFTLNEDHTVATLSVDFGADPGAPYEYRAVYYGDPANALHMQKVQNPLKNSFDPAADILVSKPSIEPEQLDELVFTMGRLVTVNKMTLTGLEPGETISSVVFALNKDMICSYRYSSVNHSYDKWMDLGKSISLYYTDITGVVDETGKFPVYFISAPVEDAAIESITVITDHHVYNKAGYTETTDPFYGRTLSFARGKMKRFNMNLTGFSKTAVVIDFSAQGYQQGESLSGKSLYVSGITVEYGTSYFVYVDSQPPYVYTSGHYSMNISCDANKKIVGIDFTIVYGQNYISANQGTYDSTTGSWTGAYKKIELSSTHDLGLQKMVVYYEDVQLYSVNVTVDPTPGVTVFGKPTGPIEAGTEVSLSLSPNLTDYVLDQLLQGTIDVTDKVKFNFNYGMLTYTFTMPAENVEITAHFKKADGVGLGRSGYNTGGGELTWGN